MNAREFLQEIGAPIANQTLLLAMLVFFLLAKLAGAAGLLGLWLLIVILPAFFRYLIAMLEARVMERKVEPPGIELFNWVQNGWTLMPLVVLVAIVWGVVTVAQTVSSAVAVALGVALSVAYPASMAVLTITRSPVASLHPIAVYTLIRTCGVRYLIIPAVVWSAAAVLWVLGRAGVPAWLLELGAVYGFFLTFSLTGAIALQGGAAGLIEDPESAEPDERAIEAAAERDRARVLDHAYGLISRGNRDGGFAHIQAHIDASPSIADDYRWFFEAMLRWEQSEPALYFAQRYLTYLLDANEQVLALKLMSRCLHESPQWKPLRDDRQRVLEVAHAHGRDELIAGLRRQA